VTKEREREKGIEEERERKAVEKQNHEVMETGNRISIKQTLDTLRDPK